MNYKRNHYVFKHMKESKFSICLQSYSIESKEALTDRLRLFYEGIKIQYMFRVDFNRIQRGPYRYLTD